MGLSQFPVTAEGVVSVLVMNTIFSMVLLKNMVRSVFHVVGAIGNSSEESNNLLDDDDEEPLPLPRIIMSENATRLRITHFKSLCNNNNNNNKIGLHLMEECCVCLCGFEADQEVTELSSCKHFFHKPCLDKWFSNKHTSCPLCRSIQ